MFVSVPDSEYENLTEMLDDLMYSHWLCIKHMRYVDDDLYLELGTRKRPTEEMQALAPEKLKEALDLLKSHFGENITFKAASEVPEIPDPDEDGEDDWFSNGD